MPSCRRCRLVVRVDRRAGPGVGGQRLPRRRDRADRAVPDRCAAARGRARGCSGRRRRWPLLLPVLVMVSSPPRPAGFVPAAAGSRPSPARCSCPPPARWSRSPPGCYYTLRRVGRRRRDHAVPAVPAIAVGRPPPDPVAAGRRGERAGVRVRPLRGRARPLRPGILAAAAVDVLWALTGCVPARLADRRAVPGRAAGHRPVGPEVDGLPGAVAADRGGLRGAAAAALGLLASQYLPLGAAVLLVAAAALLFQPAQRRLERLADRWVVRRPAGRLRGAHPLRRDAGDLTRPGRPAAQTRGRDPRRARPADGPGCGSTSRRPAARCRRPARPGSSRVTRPSRPLSFR